MNRRNLAQIRAGFALGRRLAIFRARAYPDRTDPADRAVLARRRHRRGRPAVGGADEAPIGTVVIENKGGGGGVIGATEVARSTPDGHTFVFGNTSTQVLIPAIAHKPPYDASRISPAIYIVCDLADLDRRARVGAGEARCRSSSPTPRPIRPSCPTAPPAPAP